MGEGINLARSMLKGKLKRAFNGLKTVFQFYECLEGQKLHEDSVSNQSLW